MRKIKVGELIGVIYSTDSFGEGKKKYIHKLNEKIPLPVLYAVTDDLKSWRLEVKDNGESIFLTERGIENRKARPKRGKESE